jgi:O-antigen ligase
VPQADGKARTMSAWRLPIVWLFMGPPILRGGPRDAMASLEGNLDAWNLFRMAWWLAFGLLALIEVHRQREHLPRFIHDGWVMLASATTLIFTFFLSSLFSPSPLFTIGNAALMSMAFIAAVDLGLKLRARLVIPRQVLHVCFTVSLVLLGVVAALVVVPLIVSGGWAGQRIRGGAIGGTHILSLVVFFTGLYLGLGSRAWLRVLYGSGAALGIVFLLLSQTRTAYVGFAIGAMLFAALWFGSSGLRQRLAMIGVAALMAGAATGLLLQDEFSPGEPLPERAWAYLIRSESSLRSASGRDGIFPILIREAVVQPFGLGYAAGPRVVLLSQEHEAELWYRYGVLPQRIGNAHNAYLEVFAGAGYLGSLAHLVLIAWLALGLARRRSDVYIPTKSLLLIVLIEGLTGSSAILPLNQVSVLFWILVGLAAAAEGDPVAATTRGLDGSAPPARRVRMPRTDRGQTLGGYGSHG